MLRQTFFFASFLGAVNLYFAEDTILQIFSGILFLFTLGISIIWPEPLPPPPAPDLWSEAPEKKEREMKTCSNCGKAVDQKWSMCPYCSKRV
jgi:hypothetical protein|tara:strand:- start:239 stop:514 length:276 start_codon:yes stop_codon:yes gene_type:complete